MKKIIRRIGISIGLTILTIVILFFVLVLYFNGIKINDFALQKQNIEELKELYANDYHPIDESQFVNFDLNINTLHLNEIQLLASHNSYKKIGSQIGKFFIALGENKKEADLLKYQNNSLTDQFNYGIRSIELDVRYSKSGFQTVHVPLVDNSSTSTNFALALEEVKLWSQNNPDHIPLMLLLELKNDWMILDPSLSDFTEKELGELDQLILDTFGDMLLQPKDVIGNSNTLKDAITNNGWPLLKDTLGKVIVILHPGKYTEPYVAMDSTFKNMAMFPAAENNNINNSYASFIVHNDPNVQEINSLVASNFIVRTRVDTELVPDTESLKKGIESGAQILSSDFSPNNNFENYDYVAYLQEEFTIIENTYLH